jgi:hypothetical protein
VTKQFVCDVCGEAFELDQAHLEFVVQEGMEGAVPEGTWDICSWSCVYDLTLAATASEELEDEPVAEFVAPGEAKRLQELGRQIVDDVHEQQIVIDKQDRQYAKEVEDAGTGVYFPEGMRVDGRPAEQVRKRQVPRVRLVRDDD